MLTGGFGRRWLIILAAVVLAFSPIGTAFAPTVGWVMVVLVASGISIGMAWVIWPMCIVDIVPPKVRGSPVAINMLNIPWLEHPMNARTAAASQDYES